MLARAPPPLKTPPLAHPHPTPSHQLFYQFYADRPPALAAPPKALASIDFDDEEAPAPEAGTPAAVEAAPLLGKQASAAVRGPGAAAAAAAAAAVAVAQAAAEQAALRRLARQFASALGPEPGVSMAALQVGGARGLWAAAFGVGSGAAHAAMGGPHLACPCLLPPCVTPLGTLPPLPTPGLPHALQEGPRRRPRRRGRPQGAGARRAAGLRPPPPPRTDRRRLRIALPLATNVPG
jgi:hypothetical protein